MGFNTPRTSRRLSACGFASENRLSGIAADAAFHAIIRVAAEPVIVAFAGMRIGPALRVAALRWWQRSLDGSCRRGMRRTIPPMMVPGRGGLGSGCGCGEQDADCDDQTSGALHENSLSVPTRQKIGGR